MLFGTLVAETILASVHVRAHRQAGHMDASDLIKTLQKSLQGGGRPHMGLPQRVRKCQRIRDMDHARLATAPIKLFITATNVRTGRPRVFRNAELTAEVLLASACLPTMFQAVEIDGEAYWDGGYSGNPTMTPLVQECVSDDTILVAINPVERPEIPRSARDILNRLNEVSFNAVLLKELRMIALLRQVADAGNTEGAQWAGMRIHMIRSEMMTDLGSSSKVNAEMGVSLHVARRGEARGECLPVGAR